MPDDVLVAAAEHGCGESLSGKGSERCSSRLDRDYNMIQHGDLGACGFSWVRCAGGADNDGIRSGNRTGSLVIDLRVRTAGQGLAGIGGHHANLAYRAVAVENSVDAPGHRCVSACGNLRH